MQLGSRPIRQSQMNYKCRDDRLCLGSADIGLSQNTEYLPQRCTVIYRFNSKAVFLHIFLDQDVCIKYGAGKNSICQINGSYFNVE